MDSPCRRHKHPSLERGVTRAQVRQELSDLYHRAGYTGPVDLQWTDELRQMHNQNTRRYAQVMPFLKIPHFEFAPQMVYLPLANRRALEAHELGHVLAPHADEDGADEAARRVLGIKIGYDRRWPGKGLQATRNPWLNRRNPDLPLAPRDERFLPARITAHGDPPRRHSFELMAAGEVPLIYLPEGSHTSSLPKITDALGAMLSRRPLEGGLADPRAWHDLESAVGHQTTAKLFVVDRNGERWRVLRVNIDPGGYSGEIQVQHLGRHSRGGSTRWLDPEQFYGQMLPVVVFKGWRG